MDELMERLKKAERENEKMREYIERKKLIHGWARLTDENRKMRELLQYVADNHLCSTWLIDEMHKLGIKHRDKE